MSKVTDGFVIVDKGPGMTSHDVVARFRRIAGTRRVGHAGTLDPMATGVLVLAVGAATRLLSHLDLDAKTYSAWIRLGASTTTDDAEGETVATQPAHQLTEEEVGRVVTRFVGDIMQVPATVSAIKVDGQRAYARVRAGETVQLAARPVTVRRFELIEFRRVDQFLDVLVEVDCSAGTYIRALARDLGDALGVGGHLTYLRRLRVGPFGIEDALTLEELAARADSVPLPMAQVVRTSMPVREVTAAELTELSFGRALTGIGIAGVHAALTTDGQLAALLREDIPEVDGAARPVLVFISR